MNRLVIIGNGFDLAHGLETRYTDFIKKYLSEIFLDAFNSKMKVYKNDLIKISTIPDINSEFKWEDFTESIRKVVNVQNKLHPISFVGINFKYGDFQFSIKSEFFGNALLKSIDNWVDFESLYYDHLLEILKMNLPHDGKINELNHEFSILQEELEEYLKNQNFNDTTNNLDFHWAIQGLLQCENLSYPDVTSNKKLLSGNLCILNFNYTNTIDQYLKRMNVEYTLINIHGELATNENPIIFGYGDYHHEEYTKLENANRSGFMLKLKAMHYPKTYNRQRLLQFLETGKTGMKSSDYKKYEVLILGHSCGLSDRNLLRTIFEHMNCSKIHIAYHEEANDHFLKTIELSRHFQKKEEMLDRIEPFNEKLKIPQLKNYIK